MASEISILYFHTTELSECVIQLVQSWVFVNTLVCAIYVYASSIGIGCENSYLRLTKCEMLSPKYKNYMPPKNPSEKGKVKLQYIYFVREIFPSKLNRSGM